MEHLFLIGEPGCGKTLYAQSLLTNTGTLKHAVQCEGDISALYRLAGMQMPRNKTMVPFRAPHHTVSVVGMRGILHKNFTVMPGELSLAHGGILFLDEAAEFRTVVLDEVLQALRTGEVELHARRATRVILPAQFRLVIATNPCPCGQPGKECLCTEAQRNRYLNRLDAFKEHCRVVEESEIRAKLEAK